jgi:hypothetical protein
MTPSIAAVSYTYAKYLPIKVGAAIERGSSSAAGSNGKSVVGR